jgi:hypothetical protein
LAIEWERTTYEIDEPKRVAGISAFRNSNREARNRSFGRPQKRRPISERPQPSIANQGKLGGFCQLSQLPVAY